MMKVKVKNTGPCRREVSIDVPAEKLQSVYEDALKQYIKAAAVPGFRKGKAPRAVVESKYAKELAQDVKDRVMPEAYHHAIESESLDPVTILAVEDEEVTFGQPFHLKVVLDVPPEFKLPSYKGIKLKSKTPAVENAEVESARERVLQQFVKYEDVEGRPAAIGDLVQVDFTATIDGNPLSETAPSAKSLDHATDFWMMNDENAFLPAYARQLEGLSIGDEKNIEFEFPEDFHVKELAGRKTVFRTTVKGLREKQLPELTEEQYRQLGVASDEELRNRIREDMQAAAENREQQRLRDDICAWLLKHTKLDVPESELQSETQNSIRDIVEEQTRQGVDRDQLAEKKDEIMQTAGHSASERLRLRYILHRIAGEENVDIPDADFDAHVSQMAMRYGMQPAEFREGLVKRNALENVKENMRLNKTLDVILELANVKTS